MNNNKVVIMGLGYIGLPTAALIAGKKINVHGVDINPDIVTIINSGKIHISEPDLEGLVEYVVSNNYLKAHTTPTKADTYVITVPTPFQDNYKPDLSYIYSSLDMIIPFLEPENLIIIESTSPVGTTDKMAAYLYEKLPDMKNRLHIAYCPERVLPGKIIYELEHNDRVIGGINETSTKKACEFYTQFVKGNLHTTNARTAEMCKLVENSYRDVNIAFANELSIICDKADINVWDLINLAGKHPRVNILTPGTGVGGHCIAVDPWFIVNDFESDAQLIKTARQTNLRKTEWVINKITESINLFRDNNGKSPIVACMGLAYKADIDDLRESPAMEITKKLTQAGHTVLPVEPNIDSHPELTIHPYKEAVNKADIVILLVNHKEFKTMQFTDKLLLNFVNNSII